MGPHPVNPTRKSGLALGFFQGRLLLVWEAFHAVPHNDGGTAEVIRPPGLDRLRSCDRESIATTNPIHIRILTVTHAWGDDHVHARSRQSSGCFYRYINLKIKRVSSKVTLTRLTIFIAIEFQVFRQNYCCCLTSTLC